MLVENVEELFKTNWLVPGPAANARIINNVLIVMGSLLLNSVVNGRLFKYASVPTQSYQSLRTSLHIHYGSCISGEGTGWGSDGGGGGASSGQGVCQTPLIQQLLAILQTLPAGHALALLGAGWLGADPMANASIINHVVIVIVLFS
ncbi:MAG TPA: hypothetical protein VJS13_11105 [Pyrinomonadaceae bacterium]|nr:hypothetical protein [Pyrinomonadaceae bacterium]